MLADVEMHAIQTSGNCIRNVTADQFAGVARDEVEDPRPVGELLRQWSSLHPEFSFLPRKFKIAVTGAEADRAVLKAHDVGVRILRHPATGQVGYQILAGGGLGRTPMVGKLVRDFLPKGQLLAYLDAIMRVYNSEGRRDNKFKARIKILVHEIGLETFREKVEAEFSRGADWSADENAELARIAPAFAQVAYDKLPAVSRAFEAAKLANPGFAEWAGNALFPHRVDGYAAVTVSLKPVGGVPGDMTSDQMRAFADLAERYSLDELRVTHAQNLVLPHVKLDDLFALWRALGELGIATANVGLVTDIIACPGLDYCALATARSIPVAQAISRRFGDSARQREIGPLQIKISGCINACGHHHVGAIGILGLEKKGQESYQITLGGDPTFSASIGEILGPGVTAEQTPDVIEHLVDFYLAEREEGEAFIDTWRRIGHARFKDVLRREGEDGADI